MRLKRNQFRLSGAAAMKFVVAVSALCIAITPLLAAAPKIMPADAQFTCPMEEHPDETEPAKQGPYFAPEPGKCPWCGMKLKSLEQVKWTREYRRAEAASAPSVKSPSPATQPATTAVSALPSVTATQPASPSTQPSVPVDMRYACPMESHPDEKAAADRGPFFAASPGDCPRCGMTLKPSASFKWIKPWVETHGAQVAYTCPDHPHVLARESVPCPRCERPLEPFKLMYTCPDPRHASVVSLAPGRCPHDNIALVEFRGIWLGEKMAAANIPPIAQPASVAAYRCPAHPLVHSKSPGACTICAAPLQPVEPDGAGRTAVSQPAAGAAH